MSEVFIIFSAKYLIYFLVSFFLIYFFLQNKTLKKKIIWLAVFTLPTVFAMAKILSHFYFEARPFVAENFVPLISHAADNGFPSDHGLLSFALTCIVFSFNRKWGIALFIIGIIIGTSRVYAGIHYPVDIFGSFLISAVTVLLYYIILKRFNKLD